MAIFDIVFPKVKKPEGFRSFGARRSEGQKFRQRNAVVKTDLVCKKCGCTFRPKRSDRVTFCSVECRNAAQAALSKPKLVRKCEKCGVVVGPRMMLCAECVAPAYKPKPRCVVECVGCSSPIEGVFGHKRFCLKCRKKRARATQLLLHGKVNKHRHRARKYGVLYEPINPTAVFDRDGWRCQVCLVRTPRRLRGTNNPKAPELDHRVAMAVGGTHTWDNVQCCCRKCNISKSSKKILGQHNLFPNPLILKENRGGLG